MTKQKKIDSLQKLKMLVESNRFGTGVKRLTGLCSAIIYLSCTQFIDYEQAIYLRRLLPKRRPFNSYCWRKGVKKPRIAWLNKKIEQLMGKKWNTEV